MKRGKILASTAAATLIAGAIIAGPVANAASPKPSPAVAPLSSVVGASVNVAPNAFGAASVTCPAGKIVSGGGGQTSAFDIFFTDSYASGNGWTVGGRNKGTTTQSIRAVAICLGLS